MTGAPPALAAAAQPDGHAVSEMSRQAVSRTRTATSRTTVLEFAQAEPPLKWVQQESFIYPDCIFVLDYEFHDVNSAATFTFCAGAFEQTSIDAPPVACAGAPDCPLPVDVGTFWAPTHGSHLCPQHQRFSDHVNSDDWVREALVDTTSAVLFAPARYLKELMESPDSNRLTESLRDDEQVLRPVLWNAATARADQEWLTSTWTVPQLAQATPSQASRSVLLDVLIGTFHWNAAEAAAAELLLPTFTGTTRELDDVVRHTSQG